MNKNKPLTILVIGGGASGTILALNLSKSTHQNLQIVVIEKASSLGRGLAYSTTDPNHLLNVRAQNMSAFADEPENFYQWLQKQHIITGKEPFYFAPRAVYGSYLQDLITTAASKNPSRLQLKQGTVTALTETPSGLTATLDDDSTIQADFAVLATGHDLATPPLSYVTRLDQLDLKSLPPADPVLIIGTGLSMIDAVISLDSADHTGPVIALSRRGLLPQRHKLLSPVTLSENDIPFGYEPAKFLHWLRQRIKAHQFQGGDWREVIDGLRPFNQRIWQSWSDQGKRQFLRHAKAWWDVHRHRMAPEIHDRITKSINEGHLQIISGRMHAISPDKHAFNVTYSKRGSFKSDTIQVATAIDCTGIVRDIKYSENPVLAGLIKTGTAVADPLQIGLHVNQDCALISKHGTESKRIYALGPLTRARFFEIDAIPEIRVQAATLAQQILKQTT